MECWSSFTNLYLSAGITAVLRKKRLAFFPFFLVLPIVLIFVRYVSPIYRDGFSFVSKEHDSFVQNDI